MGGWKRCESFAPYLMLCLLWITPIVSQTKADKERDGLVGPTRTLGLYSQPEGCGLNPVACFIMCKRYLAHIVLTHIVLASLS